MSKILYSNNKTGVEKAGFIEVTKQIVLRMLNICIVHLYLETVTCNPIHH